MNVIEARELAAVRVKLNAAEADRDHYRRELGIQQTNQERTRVAIGCKVSHMQARLLLALYRAAGDYVTRANILSALYCDRDEPGSDLVNVMVHQIRGKIGATKILSKPGLRGAGYALSPAGVELVKNALTVGQC